MVVAQIVAASLLASGPARAESPKVVASIPPLHSLAQQVMGEKGAVELLLPPATSPHAFTLRPSQRASLEDADLIFWIGPELETSLAPAIQSLDDASRAAPFIREGGPLALFSYRDGHHDTGDHDGEEAHGPADPHLWLSLDNAREMILRMSEGLSEADRDNAAYYGRRRTESLERLEALAQEAAARMATLTPKPYFVFHDAYQYFERDYGLAPSGVVAISPERSPSAGHLTELREKLSREAVACLFVEPQFPRNLAETVVEGSGVPLVEIDPLGVTLEPGPDAYRLLYLGLVESFENCFGGG
jgi:zinc transport system substrate-binding protein